MADEKISKPLPVGTVAVPGRVWISPMTGVSDLPFRMIATELGASYIATEMVACEHFVGGRPDVVRRAAMGDLPGLMVVQLVGFEARWIGRAAAPPPHLFPGRRVTVLLAAGRGGEVGQLVVCQRPVNER